MSSFSRRQFLALSGGVAGAMALGNRWPAAFGQPWPRQPNDGHFSRQKETTVEYRQFGKTGMRVSALGFGGAEIGYEGVEQSIVDRLLNSALDAGLNVVDTAECYPGSEESIGNAISRRRTEYVLFTKVGHEHGRGEDWSAESITRTIERSLKRLKTDLVDLVQLHSCSEDVLRKGEVIEALRKARDAGKTRYIGYSGDSKAARYAVESGAFDALQTSISIADQEAIELTLPLAREKQMGVIAKRPIANVAWRHKEEPPSSYHREYWRRLRELDYDFCKGDVGAAVGVALRFTLSQPGVHTAIVGTSKPSRWSENAKLIEAGPLPAEQMNAIRARWHAVADEDWVGQV